MLLRGALAAIAAVGLSCSGAGPPEGGDLEGLRLPGHRVVSPGVAFELLRDSPELIVLDVRPFSAYASAGGHLNRAVSLPAEDLPELWPVLRLGREETILFYGEEGGAHEETAMRFFVGIGQRYVVRIDGGLETWREGGFEIVVEDAPLSPVRID